MINLRCFICRVYRKIFIYTCWASHSALFLPAAARVLSNWWGRSAPSDAPVPITAPADSSWAPGSTRGWSRRPDQPPKQQCRVRPARVLALTRLCCRDPTGGSVGASTRATVHTHTQLLVHYVPLACTDLPLLIYQQTYYTASALYRYSLSDSSFCKFV